MRYGKIGFGCWQLGGEQTVNGMQNGWHVGPEAQRIKLIEDATVTGLLSRAANTCTGVSYKVHGDETATELSADLVVDASGASSRASSWLKKINIEPPAEHELDPLLTYGGVLVKMKPDA